MQSDEDEDNYDEVRYRIEQSIIKERLTRLATYGSPGSSPLSDDAATEEQGAAMGSVSCEAVHKRFNINSCYLCKNATAKDKKEEKKKSNSGSCYFFVFQLFMFPIHSFNVMTDEKPTVNFRL